MSSDHHDVGIQFNGGLSSVNSQSVLSYNKLINEPGLLKTDNTDLFLKFLCQYYTNEFS